MHFDYGGIFGRRAWRKVEKRAGRNIVYCRREDRARKSSSDMCLLQFSRAIRCSRREERSAATADFFRLGSRYSSERWSSLFNRTPHERAIKIVSNKINRFRRNRQTDELGKFAAVQQISESCLTRTSLGCSLRLRNVNAATQITRRSATLGKFALEGVFG